MKKKSTFGALLGFLLSLLPVYGDPQLRSDGYVTFSSVSSPTGLTSLTPTQHGWSFTGSAGEVYFHHRFYGNGEDFRIRKLSFSVDPDGDGVYGGFIDVSSLSTPGTSPKYILKRNGTTLGATVIRNALCDEVIVLNHNFLGRSFSGGVQWKLETDWPIVIQWTTHAPVAPFVGASVQDYTGSPFIIADGVTGNVIEYSYDLNTWSTYFTLTRNGVIVIGPAEEAGRPRKFFRRRS